MKTLTAPLKKKLLAMAKAHQKADEYVAGRYEFNGGACSIGCSIHDLKKLKVLPPETNPASHKEWGEFSGMGERMARVQDAIYEGLRGLAQKTFTPRLVESLRVGADYSMLWPKFAVWASAESAAWAARAESAAWAEMAEMAEMAKFWNAAAEKFIELLAA